MLKRVKHESSFITDHFKFMQEINFGSQIEHEKVVTLEQETISDRKTLLLFL